MKKRIISFILALSLTVLLLPTGASAVNVGGVDVKGQGLFIMDFETGIELYGSNADTPFVPASITKLMSMYLVYEALEEGKITRDTVVPISEKVHRLSLDWDYWNTVPLYYDETYTVGELMELILVYSASASVVAMAELLCGTEAAFVDAMNQKAQQWGIDAHFVGCSGIEDNALTPRAAAQLARKLIADYPQVLDITKKTSVSFHGAQYSTTNHLLTSQPYPGADGLKSGTTDNAGYCFLATAVRNGVRIITVVMKSTSGDQRFVDSRALLDYGFSVRNQIVHDVTMRVEPYTDVFLDDWYAEAVSAATQQGLMDGLTETTFCPKLELSRAMTATVLYRLCGAPEVTEGSQFSDIPAQAWYADAVAWAGANGIVEGYMDGTFAPENNVTRQELAVMLFRCCRYLGYPVFSAPLPEQYIDTGEVAPWAQEAMGWAVSTGLMDGVSDELLAPEGTATRAQCAALLVRFANSYPLGHD